MPPSGRGSLWQCQVPRVQCLCVAFSCSRNHSCVEGRVGAGLDKVNQNPENRRSICTHRRNLGTYLRTWGNSVSFLMITVGWRELVTPKHPCTDPQAKEPTPPFFSDEEFPEAQGLWLLYPCQVPVGLLWLNLVQCHSFTSFPLLDAFIYGTLSEMRDTHHGYISLHWGPVSYHATLGLATFSSRQKFPCRQDSNNMTHYIS